MQLRNQEQEEEIILKLTEESIGHDTPTISRASTSRALFPSSIQNATQQPHDERMYTFSELVSQDSAYAVFSSYTDSDY